MRQVSFRGKGRISSVLSGTVAVLCVMVVIWTGCTKPKAQYYELSGRLHTPYHIKYAYTVPLDEEIDAQLKYFYHLFNAFDSTSVISQVNQNKDVEVDSLFQRVFNKAMEVAELTGGAYDVTCAPMINLWGFGFSRKDSVTPEHIDSIRQFVGYKKVRLEGNRVVKDDPRLIMNFSSLADGTVCDMVAQELEKKGVQDYLVEFGGEMRMKGVNPEGKDWRLGITKPTDDATGINQELEQVVSFPIPVGMATSGNYRNFYIKDGRKYAHTIDPRLGCPVQRDILSATIVASDGMTADAFATAFMVLGSDSAKVLYSQVPGLEYFIICPDSIGEGYHTEYSEGFRKFLVDTKR